MKASYVAALLVASTVILFGARQSYGYEVETPPLLDAEDVRVGADPIEYPPAGPVVEPPIVEPMSPKFWREIRKALEDDDSGEIPTVDPDTRDLWQGLINPPFALSADEWDYSATVLQCGDSTKVVFYGRMAEGVKFDSLPELTASDLPEGFETSTNELALKGKRMIVWLRDFAPAADGQFASTDEPWIFSECSALPQDDGGPEIVRCLADLAIFEDLSMAAPEDLIARYYMPGQFRLMPSDGFVGSPFLTFKSLVEAAADRGDVCEVPLADETSPDETPNDDDSPPPVPPPAESESHVDDGGACGLIPYAGIRPLGFLLMAAALTPIARRRR